MIQQLTRSCAGCPGANSLSYFVSPEYLNHSTIPLGIWVFGEA